MAVFRIDKTRDYTVMSNHHLRNTGLSLKAKGLLSLMLSLPEEWDYTTKGLAHICKDGVDSICAGVRELEEHGYVIRERVRNENGQLGAIEYTILEQPIEPSPKREKPKQENPVQVNPILDNPVLGKPEQEKPAQWPERKSRPSGSVWQRRRIRRRRGRNKEPLTGRKSRSKIGACSYERKKTDPNQPPVCAVRVSLRQGIPGLPSGTGGGPLCKDTFHR